MVIFGGPHIKIDRAPPLKIYIISIYIIYKITFFSLLGSSSSNELHQIFIGLFDLIQRFQVIFNIQHPCTIINLSILWYFSIFNILFQGGAYIKMIRGPLKIGISHISIYLYIKVGLPAVRPHLVDAFGQKLVKSGKILSRRVAHVRQRRCVVSTQHVTHRYVTGTYRYYIQILSKYDLLLWLRARHALAEDYCEAGEYLQLLYFGGKCLT